MVMEPEVLSTLALAAEELVRTHGAPEAVRSVFTLVCEVIHDSLERFGAAGASKLVHVGL